MRKVVIALLVVVVALGLAVGVQAFAKGKHHVKADQLTGYQETPAINTSGTGTFSATIDDKSRTISYTETYSGLSSNATQSHIHFGNRFSAQGVSAFLCTNLGNGPAGTPACPPTGGTVTGTITPADVVGPVSQGISPGDFDALVRAIRAGVAYANVHTVNFPAGEIRAQINDPDQKLPK